METPSEYEPSIARGEYPMILEHPWEEESQSQLEWLLLSENLHFSLSGNTQLFF